MGEAAAPTPPWVLALHRYPVKSMLGERLDGAHLDERGVVGDRAWSVRTQQDKIGSGKSTRRFAALPHLQHVRACERDGDIVVTLPDGTPHDVRSDDLRHRLSHLVEQPVTLARELHVSHFDDGP